MSSSLITLLTDFGTDDPYVGIMKGVLHARRPGVSVIDLTHAVAPGDTRAAALALHHAHGYFPPGTVHTCVVDPGVGGKRRILAAHGHGQFFLAPDTGLIPAALDPFGSKAVAARYRSVENQDLFLPSMSHTFHGRDIFAPVAAFLAGGGPLSELGPVIQDPVVIALPRPTRKDGRLTGEILHVDRFGNLVSNIKQSDLPDAEIAITLEQNKITGLQRTYTDVSSGAPLALIGSSGFLEISVRDGNAARHFKAHRGTALSISSQEAGP